jgi:hypothetical protein
MVKPSQRKKWEHYVSQNYFWLNETMAIQETWNGYYGAIGYDWERKDIIWGDSGEIEANASYVTILSGDRRYRILKHTHTQHFSFSLFLIIQPTDGSSVANVPIASRGKWSKVLDDFYLLATNRTIIFLCLSESIQEHPYNWDWLSTTPDYSESLFASINGHKTVMSAPYLIPILDRKYIELDQKKFLSVGKLGFSLYPIFFICC